MPRKRTSIIALLLTLALSSQATDRDRRSAQQFAVWSSVVGQLQVADRWWLTSEVHVRRFDGLAQPMQTGLLLAPEYRAGRWSLQAGYAFWNTAPYGAFRTPAAQREHRGWTQAGLQHGVGRLAMDHRVRVEHRSLERFLASPEGAVAQGFRYVGRVRYRTRLIAPLNGRQGKAGEWQAILQKEWMLRYADDRFVGAFDQVRPAVALGYRPLPNLQFTAGYQMHYLVRANGVDEEMNHTLMVGAFWRLPKRLRSVAGPGEIAQGSGVPGL